MTEQDTKLTELPKGWLGVRLGQISTTTSGGTPLRNHQEYFGGTIPWLKSGELNNGLITRSEETITEVGLNCSSSKIIPSGTLLIALYGATTGKLGVLGIDAAINQAICAITLPSEIDNTFLFYYLTLYRDNLLNSRKGGAQPNISQQIVNEIELPLPPFSEQHRIVTKIEELFTRLDDGVAELKKVQLQLKRYRQSVLKSTFDGTLTAEWREEHKEEFEPASILLEKIKSVHKKSINYKELPRTDTSGLVELPEGWVYLTLDCLAKNEPNAIRRGPFGSSIKKSMFVPSGYKIYEQGNVIYNDFKRGDYYISDTKFQEMKSFEIIPGDVLISCSGTVGKIAIVPEGIQKGIINQALLKISLNNGIIITPYFTYLLRSQIDEVIRNNTRGSAMLNISSVKDLRNIPFAIPSVNEQQQIVETIERCFSVADEIETIIELSLKQSERLRQSILKTAFEGKLLPQDSDDEPADKLLERIKAEKLKTQAKGRRTIHE